MEATTPFRPDNVTNFFIRVHNDVDGPGVRLQDFRHMTATELIGAGLTFAPSPVGSAMPITPSCCGSMRTSWKSGTGQLPP
jgi:hypothetical protein